MKSKTISMNKKLGLTHCRKISRVRRVVMNEISTKTSPAKIVFKVKAHIDKTHTANSKLTPRLLKTSQLSPATIHQTPCDLKKM